MICTTPNRQTYSKQSYNWGDLRILRRGISYSCVIHPQHVEAINRGEDFTDEQGCRWKTSIAEGIATLRHGNNRFHISLTELNA